MKARLEERIRTLEADTRDRGRAALEARQLKYVLERRFVEGGLLGLESGREGSKDHSGL